MILDKSLNQSMLQQFPPEKWLLIVPSSWVVRMVLVSVYVVCRTVGDPRQ